MNREEIIRMAREAGDYLVDKRGREDFIFDCYGIESFANLVAAAEREVIAKMIEDVPPLVRFAQNDKGGCLMCGFTPKLAAETIRARGQ
jgi:hypothetical protein